jgi:hypothetical protein
MASVAIYPHSSQSGLSALEGDDIERRSDPRLSCLPYDSVRRTVILNNVALHENSLAPGDFPTPCRSYSLSVP